ncbi:DUF3604 domain-containing protein [Cognatishimia sp. F0-27]|uniref:DUF3604 domain-containing protein n=1 Tax=Cognatishimia sp. F0-27 TaxID=2816855 RepID=UPI001D0C5DF1|nr:DUF3604 domain-containing protein [Cognatishimia sp. F0-27]MCC1491197.1 DUF3604 domain-containing protein [Cognatishimia sp. F0-27]
MSDPNALMTPLEMHNGTLRSPIDPALLGTAVLDKTGAFEAGSYQSFTLTYTAGRFGIDDSGSLRIVWRFATDQTNPQFTDPEAPGYTEVTASNKAVLEARFDPKGNIRPWDRTLQIKVVRGFMKEGDTITVRFGVTDHGSPGMRLQTFCEHHYPFRVLVDPIATYNFQTLPEQPAISIVPGAPDTWVAVIPSTIARDAPFTLKIKAEDRWGNPTDKAAITLTPRANRTVAGLPEMIDIQPGGFATEIAGLRVDEDGPLEITLHAPDGTTLATCNPAEVAQAPTLLSYWGDLHGQSDETLGTNSAADYFTFGRDRAFLDACAHQGNDFQMTDTFWKDLNKVTAHFNEDGRFVTLPGYEWSGNTALGGDRNVFFPHEGRMMRRSSHALIEDQSDAGTDCHTAAALFEAFAEAGEWDVICFAHCGGRYADITQAHDGRFEKSVEVHSAWGTFEWIVQDAFKAGYRVGIIGNSDGHKGRPGASYPGAGWFGAVGGLTCFLMPELTREGLIACINRRHHYATTGGPNGRLRMAVTMRFDDDATLCLSDPALGDSYETTPCDGAMMGDIVHLPSGAAHLDLQVDAGAPVRRIDIFNGLDHVACHRPYGPDDLGDRIGVWWEGAEYRGRFRAVPWDGTARFDAARIKAAQPVNFFNRDKTLDQPSASELTWKSVTTGNLAGFIATLEDSRAGSIALNTPLITQSVALADIGYEDRLLDASDALPRGICLFRLPDENPHRSVSLTHTLDPQEGRDNPFYVRVTLEDGTQAWSSPIYVLRSL